MNAKKLSSLALGSTFAALTMASAAQAAGNPFSVTAVGDSYAYSTTKSSEARCGEAKCGEAKCGEAKCGEAKCGEAKCGEDKAGEAKCGEAKCGS